MPSSHVTIGLVGKPNAGKSTLFSAMCETQADIGQYPFTTIKPNVGVSYITADCPHTETGNECKPNFGKCDNGKRLVPVEVVDIPGLIRGASTGKGMGNEFLENIKDAIVILQVYDASGHTAEDGSIIEQGGEDPVNEINLVRSELAMWVTGRLKDDWERFSKRADLSGEPFEKALLKKVSSIGLNQSDLHTIFTMAKFPQKFEKWGDSDFDNFAEAVFTGLKAMIAVGNKADLLTEDQRTELMKRIPGTLLISAEYELTVSRAFSNGFIGSTDPPFEIKHDLNEKQKAGLEKISDLFASSSVKRTRDLLTHIVKEVLGRIVVYPVYDETHWTDKNGNVLPDAFIMKNGETALDLAYRIHTDIGENFIKAIDARTRRTVGRDHELHDGDVIKIVAKSN